MKRPNRSANLSTCTRTANRHDDEHNGPRYAGTLALTHATGPLTFQILGGLRITRTVVIELRRETDQTDCFTRRIGRCRLTTYLGPVRPDELCAGHLVASADLSGGVRERIGPARFGVALDFDMAIQDGFNLLTLRSVALGRLRLTPSRFDVVVQARCEPNALSIAVAVRMGSRSLLTYSGELS